MYDSVGDVFARNLDTSFVTVCVTFMGGLIIGGLIATILWFRWYLNGDPMNAVESYANKEWGEE